MHKGLRLLVGKTVLSSAIDWNSSDLEIEFDDHIFFKTFSGILALSGEENYYLRRLENRLVSSYDQSFLFETFE
jgi:hypothetical protein